ncbi:MAG: VOC family protein [Halobacteriaceae archaeon]
MSTDPHLGHVHLKVRDLDRSVTFYERMLDLTERERHHRYAFLSWGDHHHDVALQAIGEDAPPPGPGVGLYHAAVEVPDAATLTEIYDRLIDAGVGVTPVDHGISRALYFDDPDGNGLEVYRDTRAEREIETWGGRNDRFDPSDS